MSLARRLFRESALERLSSPEQLDQQLHVTGARSWVALLFLWVLLAAIVAWSILGTVHTKEEGRGILVAGGGLKVVVAPGAGRLAAFLVDVGNPVSEGQLVARIDRQDIADELAEAESQLAELRAQNERHDAFDRREEELQAELDRVETARLRREIEAAGRRIERLAQRRAIIQELVAGGMMTEIELHEVDEESEKSELERDQAALEIEQVQVASSNAGFQRTRERMRRQLQLEELLGRTSMLRSRLERETRVVSPYAGRVVELRAAAHTAVAAGDSVLLVEPAGETARELEAILYVPATTGKRVRPGMEVFISPDTVRREEHGSMRGVVASVADGPTSRLAMLAVLTAEDLVEQFTLEIGLPLQVRVTLVQDAATPSGYGWTSSSGPPARVSAGTLCRGAVTLEVKRPVELVIPLVRGKMGGD